MTATLNIYCDESCHLLNDQQAVMVLGAVWCWKNEAQTHNANIAAIKKRHNLSPYFEVKWTKVSPGKMPFYEELLDYFFTSQGLGFRGWVVPDKSVLRHDQFGQTHDDWYYKMYFYLLRNLISTDRKHHIYLDIKDTRSRMKLQKLWEVLSNAKYDFSRDIIEKIQHVHSHDIGILQLADLIIGALSYHHRNLQSSAAKGTVVNLIKSKSNLSLDQNTLPNASKFNLCIWRPNGGGFEHA